MAYNVPECSKLKLSSSVVIRKWVLSFTLFISTDKYNAKGCDCKGLSNFQRMGLSWSLTEITF